MNTDRAWIAFLLVFVIVVISNALMFALARGSRNINLRGWRDAWDITRRTYSGDQNDLDELRQRVKDLSGDEEEQAPGEDGNTP